MDVPSVVGFSVLLYDIFLTFGTEVQVIWSKRGLVLPKVAYIVNRYGACITCMIYLSCKRGIIPYFSKSKVTIMSIGKLADKLYPQL